MAVVALCAGPMPHRAGAQPVATIPAPTVPAPTTPVPAAASAAPDAAAGVPGAELTVYLMTIGQGDAVWERFGHNAIWIHDARGGTDVAYNWGMFDFNQPNFIARFLTGDTRYWMEGFDARLLAEHYAVNENRSVYAQELALTPLQRAALRDFVEWNAREENKFYRYDYYRDNCSTRVRDALDRALGGALRRALVGVPTGSTWRSNTRRLTDGLPAVYAGIQLALGRGADAPLDAWQESFLPVQLMRHVREVRVRTADGALVPLVRSERTLFTSPRPPEEQQAPSHALAFLAAGLGIGALIGLAGWTARTAGGAGRAALALFGGAWALVIGFFGTALLLAGTVTKHVPYMGRNWNLLGANPLGLVLLVVLVIAMAARTPAARARWTGRAERVAALAAALAIVGAAIVALPGIGQRSRELFALLVPAHLALWGALRAETTDADRKARTPAAVRHPAGMR